MSNYGAINSNSRHHGRQDEDISPLLLAQRPKLAARLNRHLNATISTKHGDLALLFCYIITGLLDSSAIYTWGSFVSMQTGNTIYLGSGLLSPTKNDRWLRALIAILSFCLGSFCFSHWHRHFGAKKRWVLVTSYFVQFLMVVVAAILVTIGPEMTPQTPISVWVVVPLVLLGLQSAGQAVVSRVLEYGSLTSVVLTSIYCDLFSDSRLFASLGENAERNRRAAAPVLLLLGAIIGAVWDKSPIGLTGALWTAAVMKAAVVLMWVFWSTDKDSEAEPERE